MLQVAVARLLGYRWPAEEDTGMELADEQREWVRRCEGLLTLRRQGRHRLHPAGAWRAGGA